MFSHTARVIAIIALLFGLMSTALGLVGEEGALARYTSKLSPAQVADRGINTILFAVALGTLAEISFSLRKATRD